MTRRHAKEYRPDEALALIGADREGRHLACPSCGSDALDRHPPRDRKEPHAGRVILSCRACGRSASYTDPVTR